MVGWEGVSFLQQPHKFHAGGKTTAGGRHRDRSRQSWDPHAPIPSWGGSGYPALTPGLIWGKLLCPWGLQPSTATKESLLYATELECQCLQSEQLQRAKYVRWPSCLRPKRRGRDQSLLTQVSLTQPSAPTFQPRSEGPVFLTACTQTQSRATFCRSNLGRSGMGLGPTVPTSGGSRLRSEPSHRGH